MRIVFSLVGLLVVLVVVLMLAKKQLHAVVPAAGPEASAPLPPAAQAERAAQQIQRAMEQGAAARASEAEQ